MFLTSIIKCVFVRPFVCAYVCVYVCVRMCMCVRERVTRVIPHLIVPFAFVYLVPSTVANEAM